MYGILAEVGPTAQAIFTAEALKAFVTNFFSLVTANLPVILPIAGTRTKTDGAGVCSPTPFSKKGLLWTQRVYN